MWSRLKRKLLRTKPAVEDTRGEEPSGSHIPRTAAFGGSTDNSLQRNSAIESSASAQDCQDDCRCSPLLHLQKHFFGNFRNRKVVEDVPGDVNVSEEKENSCDKRSNVEGTGVKPVEADTERKSLSTTGCNETRSSNDFVSASKEVDTKVKIENGCELHRIDVEFHNDLRHEGERSDVGLESLLTTGVESPESRKQFKDSVQKELELELNQNSGAADLTTVSVHAEPNNLLYSGAGVARESSRKGMVTAKGKGKYSDKENEVYQGDDKEEGSLDSGHHLSEGDAEKGHSSPDLEVDLEYDGRESGYTTLDDNHVHPYSFSQSPYKFNLADSVFAERVDPGSADTRNIRYSSERLDLPAYCAEPSTDRSTSTWRDTLGDSPAIVGASQVCERLSGSETFPPRTDGKGDDRVVRTRERVDYVPADASVSKIYEDCSNLATNDVYAQIPRAFVAKSEEISTFEAVMREDDRRTADRTTEVNLTDGLMRETHPECCAFSGVSAMAIEDHVGNVTAEANFSEFHDADEIDVLPPLPERNYDLNATSMGAGPSFSDTEFLEENPEQIHMSWEELMREAKCLGIPLHHPYADKTAVNPLSPVAGDSDVVVPHELETCCGVMCSRELSYWNSGILRNKTQTKKGSPFKEKFRLPNPFAKKNKGERSVSCSENSPKHASARGNKSVFRHHSSVDIQKRCLPKPPLSEQRYNCCSSVIDQSDGEAVQKASKPGTHRMAVSLHLPFSSDEPTSRSWGSSSNIPQDLTTAESDNRSRRVFSESTHWPNSSSASALSFNSNRNGQALCLDASTSADSTNANADFIQSFSKLKDCGWYWGPLGWENAEAKLEDKPDGSFLVRDSSDDRYILSLSFRSQNLTHHTRIEHYKGMFSFYSQPKSHGASTIVEFIEKAMEHSCSGKFLYFLRPRAPGLPPAPVQLLYPISRLRNMHSLQHVCRFVILKHVRRDLIDLLPIPPRLKDYLKETQYYTEYSDCDSMGHQYFSQEW